MKSSYGRLGLNLENRKSYTYKKMSKTKVDIPSKTIERISPVNGEFPAEYIEVEKKKTSYTDTVPGIFMSLAYLKAHTKTEKLHVYTNKITECFC